MEQRIRQATIDEQHHQLRMGQRQGVVHQGQRRAQFVAGVAREGLFAPQHRLQFGKGGFQAARQETDLVGTLAFAAAQRAARLKLPGFLHQSVRHPGCRATS